MKTFFIIFMYMDNDRDLYVLLATKLAGLEYDGIKITSIKSVLLNEVIVNVEDNNTHWGPNHMVGFYQAVYDRLNEVVGELGLRFAIGDFFLKGGVPDVRLHILNPSLNMFPAYIRHQFVLPVVVRKIPEMIHEGYYHIPEEVLQTVNEVLTTIQSQKNVPVRHKHLMKMLMKGSLTIKLDEGSYPLRSEPMSATYELPEGSHINSTVIPTNRWRIEGKLWLGFETPFNITINETEERVKEVLERSGNADDINHALITGAFRSFEKFVSIHKLKLSQQSHEICDMLVINTPIGTFENKFKNLNKQSRR